jgi:hypothetical protein
MSAFASPVVVWRGSTAPDAPLVVLLHGRGSSADDIIGLAEHLPAGAAYAAVRAPIAEGGGFAWFANRGIGRPIADSLISTMAWFRAWLDDDATSGRSVVLVGFSGGAAFAGGLLPDDRGPRPGWTRTQHRRARRTAAVAHHHPRRRRSTAMPPRQLTHVTVSSDGCTASGSTVIVRCWNSGSPQRI